MKRTHFKFPLRLMSILQSAGVCLVMNFLAPGGPSAAELQEVFHRLAQTCWIIGASLSSWNPDLDTDGHTQNICMALLHTLIDID